jgi:uncharacterized protein (TIGR03067 family)
MMSGRLEILAPTVLYSFVDLRENFLERDALLGSIDMNRLWVVALLFTALSGSLARGEGGSDMTQMEGTWRPETAELAGREYPKKILDSMKLVVKGETYLVEVGGHTDEGTTKLDPGKSPRAIDIKGVKGPNVGKTFLAIYELKGDDLKVCYDLSGKSRPTEFSTKPETLLFLVRYRRVKP